MSLVARKPVFGVVDEVKLKAQAVSTQYVLVSITDFNSCILDDFIFMNSCALCVLLRLCWSNQL